MKRTFEIDEDKFDIAVHLPIQSTLRLESLERIGKKINMDEELKEQYFKTVDALKSDMRTYREILLMGINK